MKISTIILALSVAPAFCSIPVVAGATAIYDNLSAASGGYAHISSSDHGPLADSFSTGAAPVDLTDVKVLVAADTPTDGGSFTVSLLADKATSPGATIATLGTVADSSLTTSGGVIDFPLVTPIDLASHTRYWIELAGGVTSGGWSYDQTNTGIGVAMEYNFYAGSVSLNSSFTPYQMQVNVSGVPESATWTMLIAGLGLSGFALRRRGALTSA